MVCCFWIVSSCNTTGRCDHELTCLVYPAGKFMCSMSFFFFFGESKTPQLLTNCMPPSRPYYLSPLPSIFLSKSALTMFGVLVTKRTTIAVARLQIAHHSILEPFPIARQPPLDRGLEARNRPLFVARFSEQRHFCTPQGGPNLAIWWEWLSN